MKYSELIKELEYWKRISEEEDPEVVVNDDGIGIVESDNDDADKKMEEMLNGSFGK